MTDTFSINLTNLLPFDLTISEIDHSLVLSKGVMSGKISFDSLKLDLERNFDIVTNSIQLKQLNNKNILLYYNSTKTIDQTDIEYLLQEIVATELPYNLTNTSTKKPLNYISKDLFGIPLIGSFYFGVIDRGTNVLQIRSITGCPLNCPFCSVDEGPVSKTKTRDFIVDTDYLVETYDFVIKQKELENAEAHLDGQGEPMAYPYLVELVQKLNENPSTNIVSIQTNGWFLTEQLIDELAEVGLNRINLSLNSIDLSLGKKMAGRGDYNHKHILELAEYIAQSKISLLIAPLWIPGVNDDEIEKIIAFTKQINSHESKFPILGIQNYLVHNEGRNMKDVKPQQFRVFYKKLREFEDKLAVKNLVLKQEMFHTKKAKMLSNPMKMNAIVLAEIVSHGRLANEIICKANDRLIHVSGVMDYSIGRKIKVRIIRNRHNIFF
ncbi:MAG: radical SAM protein, partial [Asgard group archaeon]|nr:radical SAM protein [Asgard group archaeon]